MWDQNFPTSFLINALFGIDSWWTCPISCKLLTSISSVSVDVLFRVRAASISVLWKPFHLCCLSNLLCLFSLDVFDLIFCRHLSPPSSSPPLWASGFVWRSSKMRRRTLLAPSWDKICRPYLDMSLTSDSEPFLARFCSMWILLWGQFGPEC